MTRNSKNGKFWFSEDTSRSFTATIIDEEELTIDINTIEDSYFISELIRGKDSILIHGEMSDAEKVTAVLFEPNTKTRMNFEANTYNERLIFGIKWLFYGEHFPSSDIKFNGLVINFNGINKWITPSDILFSKKEGHSKIWNINIDKDYSLKFFYGKPITESDNLTADNIRENVYFRIEPLEGDRKFEELLEQKNIIQDFLNFVVTKNIVLAQSIYGIIKKEGSEKLIKIKYRINLDLKSNKSNVLSPLLFHCREYGEDRLADFIRKWFEFRRHHRFVYNFYIDSLYKSDAVELSYFKLVAFLEGYHRDLIETQNESPTARLKELCYQSIKASLKQGEIQKSDIKLVKDLLNRLQIRKLMLNQRLRELFDFYSELVSLNAITLSFFGKDQLREWIKQAFVDEEVNERLSEALEMKFVADSEIIREKREERYNKIMEFFQSEQNKRLNLNFKMLLFARQLLTERFPLIFAKYRNAMAHLLSKEYEESPFRWYYAFKIMQFTGLLYMLKILGFDKKEIEEMFFFNEMDDSARLRVIIEARIGG